VFIPSTINACAYDAPVSFEFSLVVCALEILLPTSGPQAQGVGLRELGQSKTACLLTFPEGVLARVCDVQETVFILVFFIDATHQGGGWGKNLINEDEDGLFG